MHVEIKNVVPFLSGNRSRHDAFHIDAACCEVIEDSRQGSWLIIERKDNGRGVFSGA